jgi:hypothetical protein
MGYLFQRKQRDGTTNGPWWMKYYVNGRPLRESTGTADYAKAKRVLKDREGRAATGLPIPRRVDRIRYDELAEDLRRHYAVTSDRNLEEAEDRLKPLGRFFSGRRVVDITGATLNQYIERRQQEGVANNTINNELNVLSRMLRLGYEHNKVLRLPVFHKLKGADPRKGFFEETRSQRCAGSCGPICKSP